MVQDVAEIFIAASFLAVSGIPSNMRAFAPPPTHHPGTRGADYLSGDPNSSLQKIRDPGMSLQEND